MNSCILLGCHDELPHFMYIYNMIYFGLPYAMKVQVHMHVYFTVILLTGSLHTSDTTVYNLISLTSNLSIPRTTFYNMKYP